MSEPTPSRASSRQALLSWVVVAFLLANVVVVGYLIQACRDVQGQLHGFEREMRLYKLERVPPSGYPEAFGFKAYLNHLIYWAPKLQVASIGHERPYIEAKVRGIVDGMAALEDIYPRIESTYLKAGSLSEDPATNDEVLKWLLLAARGADDEHGTNLVVRTLRGKDFPVSQRLRWMASNILLRGREQDKKRAGEVLHEILTTETFTGTRPGTTTGPLVASGGQFYNFVIQYVATGHPEIEATMLMLLGRRDHNRLTIQKAIEQLGRMKSKRAVEPIQTLFENPPWRTGDNGLFRQKCLNMLDEILGADVVPYLERIERKETDAFVRNTINGLRKKYPPTRPR